MKILANTIATNRLTTPGVCIGLVVIRMVTVALHRVNKPA